MTISTLPKEIILQDAVALFNGEVVGLGIDPLITLLQTDAAVAIRHHCDFGYLDAVFEGPAVAVALVCLELLLGGGGGGCWFCHCGTIAWCLV